MARYLLRALRQLKVGDNLRQPGELVPEAASWPGLRHYENLQWLERVPVPEDYAGEGAIEYPPVTATSRLGEILASEREPTPIPVAWSRKTGASVAIRCRNCRVRNWLPSDFLETATWMCHGCAQPQTSVQAKEHPAPSSLEEYAEMVSEEYVDEKGDLDHDSWIAKGRSEDLSDAFKASVAR